MFPLKVFKASAGSGKTFTLTVEYIKLLIADPTVYKHILAVTFTNKATAEMKSRIVNQLYGIGTSLPSSNQYLAAIKTDGNIRRMHLSDDGIRERARQALSLIIHDYSRFHIETIDSFFQSIIKELARELDLTANLRIDLNDKEVLSEAVKGIISELKDNTPIFNSVMDFVMEKVQEGKNWNIEGEIEEFGKNIFNEHYLEKEHLISSKITDSAFLKQYKSMLYAKKNKVITLLQDKGQTFLSYCERDGNLQVCDFKQGSNGIYVFFEKLSKGKLWDSKKQFIRPNSYVLKCQLSPKEWAKSDKAKNAIGADYFDLLNDTLSLLAEAEKTIATTDAISAHINHLMMLDLINSRVRTLNQDANRFLLSDTARFLRNMIDGSDIPFIYERTGSRFKHIMIDEFQDTSTLQWENFKPLLYNSLSQNNKCLIVGDVKQSIYRWRNSDWNILNNIERSDMGRMADPATIASLDTNHRSKEHIVEFNNRFFTEASHLVGTQYEKLCGHHTEDVENAYREVRQKVSKKNLEQGYVQIVNIQPEDDEADYEQITLKRLKQTVDELINNGVQANDITILIRVNRHIPTISQYFIDNDSNVKIVSEEAFRLSSSAAVNIIMQALRFIANPDDMIARLSLAYLYQTAVTGNDLQGDISLLMEPDSQDMETSCPIDKFLPAAFIENMQEYALTPLSQLAEDLYEVFQLHNIPEQDAYLFYFYDNVTSFLKDRTADIQEFITYWDETLKDKTIPENSLDGIRIMSIHKSKGLEFHTVIIPFCDWDMNGRHSNILWCEPQEQPYKALSLTPVNFTQNTQKSIFQNDYEQEMLKNFVDNLNLIYVAFTRAESNLIVFTGNNPKNKNKGYTTTEVICEAVQPLVTSGAMSETIDDEADIYTSGTLVLSQKSETSKSRHNHLKVEFTHNKRTTTFRQSNLSEIFIKDTEEAEQQEHYINEGNVIHHLLEFITSPDDLDKAIIRLDTEGCFASEEDKERIRDKVSKAFANPRTAEWFSPRWKLYNERTILTTDENGKSVTLRPDRVMTDGKQTIVIDYKTGKQSETHINQIKRYMQQLAIMGNTTVRGYLWYIGRDEIIEV